MIAKLPTDRLATPNPLTALEEYMRAGHRIVVRSDRPNGPNGRITIELKIEDDERKNMP